MEQYTFNKEQLVDIMYGYAAHVDHFDTKAISPSDWLSRHAPTQTSPAPQDVPVPFDSVRSSILKHFTTDMKKALIEWMLEYEDMKPDVPVGPWSYTKVRAAIADIQQRDLFLNSQGGIETVRASTSLAAFMMEELKRVQEAQAGVWVRATDRLPIVHSDEPVIVRSLLSGNVKRTKHFGRSDGWDMGADYQFLYSNTEWLDESPSLPVKEQIDPVKFAEWVAEKLTWGGNGQELLDQYTQSLQNKQP